MKPAALANIGALVTHARHVPATERERFATAVRGEVSDGALVIETCHRVEVYLASEDGAARVVAALPPGGRRLQGNEAVRHAMSVAVGRDSVVVGEDQILHQLRASVEAARVNGTLDPALERLFNLALQAGRRARSWRQGPPRSLADVALAAIERQGIAIRDTEILVVGAGSMGRLVARAGVAAGSSVAVANRSADRAQALADSVGARAELFDPGPRIGAFAGIVVALKGPWPIRAATIKALATSQTIVVDLSVPQAIPAALPDLIGARLVTADALAVSDVAPTADDGSTARLDDLVNRSTAEFLAWQNGRGRRLAAEALVERADREREVELEALWRRLPDLEPEVRHAIEGMTRHLAKRLLREPLERLGRDADGREERAIRDIFAL